MNYTDPNSRENNTALGVEEPAVSYYSGKAGNAFAEPYKAEWDDYNDDDDDDDEPMTPEKAAAIRKDPAFIAWEQEVIRKIWEGVEALKAGKVRPFDEAMRDFWRRVENGEL